jgi:hypothetical protein
MKMTKDVNQYGQFPVFISSSYLQKLVSDAVNIHHNLNNTLYLKSAVWPIPPPSTGKLNLDRMYSM